MKKILSGFAGSVGAASVFGMATCPCPEHFLFWIIGMIPALGLVAAWLKSKLHKHHHCSCEKEC
jgi:hypothetical protein